MSLLFRVASLLLVLWWPAAVPAHTGGMTGFVNITIRGDAVRYNLALSEVSAGPLHEAMKLGQPGVAPDYPALLKAMGEKVVLESESGPCVAHPASVQPPSADNIKLLGVVDYRCPAPIRTLRIRDNMPEVLGESHHSLALILWDGGSQQFAFGGDARETRVDLGSKANAPKGAGSYFPLGIEHILLGYDHLLFLLMLILRGGNLIQLLKIITGFTVAHSITLALAAMDLVVLPGTLVEAVIALSIAYVAAENLFPKYAASRRWAVSFAFGLMHGFGFSSVLREIGLPKENLLLSLLNFNLGVEAGQAAVVLLLIPILLKLRKTTWEPRVVLVLSGIVMFVGLGLFVDRAFLAG
ncbi:MAG: HupE/UreJ family protein [Burkholderiales bacterium]